MPTCEICGEEVEHVHECKVCGAYFCDGCGDTETGTCIDCSYPEEEYEEPEEDFEDDY